MEISLRPGEALRIENEDGSIMTVFAPPGAALWEIRVAARELALFDERLLTDIMSQQGLL